MKHISKFTKIDSSEKTPTIRKLFVGITDNDELYFLKVGDRGNQNFSISGDTVMKVEEERAMENTIEHLEDLYEQGLFDINYINFDYIDEDWFQNALEESNRAYAEDIAQEDADGYPSRLAEELVERGVVSEDDTQEDDFDAEDYIDKFVDDMNNDYDDPTDWFIDSYGEEEFKRVLIDERLLDVEEVVSDMDYSYKMEYFDNSTLTDEVVGKDGDTYLFEAVGGGQNRDELDDLKITFLPKSFINQLKKNWDKYHLKQLPKSEFFPEVEQDEEAILEYYVNNDLQTYEKGGQMENVKVKQIVYSKNGEYTLDEYQKLSNEEFMGFAPIPLYIAKNGLFEINDEAIEYEEDIQDIKSVDELADFVYENGLGNIENTYNYSWWGGTRQYIIVNNSDEKFDADYPTMVFLSYHRGGDVRGNYEKYEAFFIDGYFFEDFPIMSDRMTVIVEKDGKSMNADTEDMEGYDLYINESDFDEFEEGDNTNLDEIGEKLGFEAYKYYKAGGKTKRSKHSIMQDRRRVSKESWEVAYQKRKKNKMEAGGTLPTPFGQAGLVGETGAMNEMDMFAMGGGLPQGVQQYYANTYNPAYPTPHGYAKGGEIEKPYQVYNSATNNVEGYFDNEFEAEDFANQFEDAEVYDLRLMAKGGKTDEYVAITLKPKKSAYKGGKGEVYENMQTFYDTINAKENEDKYDFIHNLFISDSRKSDPQDISEIKVYMIGEKSGFDDVEKRGLYDLFDLVKTKEEVKDYAKGGEIGKEKLKKEIDRELGLMSFDVASRNRISKKHFNELVSLRKKVKQLEKGENIDKEKLKKELDRELGLMSFDVASSNRISEKHFNELVSLRKKVKQLEKGGKTQGYNDKLDESLGNTKGKRSKKEQNYKDRRNESEAMEKKGGKRKYSRVKTMDKGNRKKRQTPMSLAKEIRKEGEKWQDAVKRASAMLKKK